jgi:hypothetical protein
MRARVANYHPTSLFHTVSPRTKVNKGMKKGQGCYGPGWASAWTALDGDGSRAVAEVDTYLALRPTSPARNATSANTQSPMIDHIPLIAGAPCAA